MTTDDERAQKIAEAKARAEAARAARAGGASTSPPPASEATPPTPVASPAAAEPVAVTPPAPASVEAGGADDRARKIAEAKARAEAARAGRTGGVAPTPAAAAAPAPPVAAEAVGAAPSAAAPAGGADDRARRIEEAKARAAAARAGGAAPAPRPSDAPEPVGAGAAAMAPAGDWKGVATAPSRVITARADTGLAVRREMQTAEVQNLMTRRSLVRSSFWVTLGVTMAGLALGFVQFFWPRQVVGFGGIFKISATAVPKPGEPPKRFPEGKLYLVNLEAGGGVPPAFTGIAAPSAKGGLLALWQKCPHLGCTVPWRGDFDFEGVRGWFRCPCHGSTYTQAGIRVFGPAPRPMDTFALKLNGDGSVDVDTSKVTRGGPDNPQRAVLA